MYINISCTLTELISSNSFQSFLRIFHTRHYLICFSYSLTIWCLFKKSTLMALAWTSSAMFNRSGKNHLFLLSVLAGKAFSLWLVSVVLAEGYQSMSFHRLRIKGNLYSYLVECFCHKKMLTPSNGFSVSVRMIM